MSRRSFTGPRKPPRTNGLGKGFAFIAISEDAKLVIKVALDKLKANENETEYDFPPTLSSEERAFVHRYSSDVGLTSKSYGKDSTRFVKVFKKIKTDGLYSSKLNISADVCSTISNFLHSIPPPQVSENEVRSAVAKKSGNSFTKHSFLNSDAKIPTSCGCVPAVSKECNALPISNHRQTIIDTMNSSRVMIIDGSTGCGKTTQVPQFIMDDCYNTNTKCKILMTEPRRIAAVGAATRIAMERGEDVGNSVGYQVRLDSKLSARTVLHVCTTGVALRLLLDGNDAWSSFTHIIIDEVHERDLDTDFLLICFRDLLTKHNGIKLILMSATINISLFETYFDNCPVVSIPPMLCYPITTLFLGDILTLIDYKNATMKKLLCQNNVDQTSRVAREAVESNMMQGMRTDQELDAHGLPVSAQINMQEDILDDMDECIEQAWLTDDRDYHDQMLHLIVNEGIPVNYAHRQTGMTALMVASARGHVDVVEHLIDCSADMEVVEPKSGLTAMEIANNFNQKDVSELLVLKQQSSAVISESMARLGVAPNNGLLSSEEEGDKLCDVYHRSFDDSNIDYGLIKAILHYIVNKSKDGSILIFLTGYQDICMMQEMLSRNKAFSNPSKYSILMLHSMIPLSHQREIFKPSRHGVRKIILSTNIAESSITINDVVDVIDCGRVKEASHDASAAVDLLSSCWISKASALQRRGRAGRCRIGNCYHLFSAKRFESMQLHQDAELLRMPLYEKCLQARKFAPSHITVVEFLSKAPEPPRSFAVSNAVRVLIRIGAMASDEKLTDLGRLLLELPLDPKFGKMVLFGVALQCLDPVLTIAAFMSCKEAFTLQVSEQEKRSADGVKQRLAQNTWSDHVVLLRLYEGWTRARREGWDQDFCRRHFVSTIVLNMVDGIRRQLASCLRHLGFIHGKTMMGADCPQLNTNSASTAVVKAALCAGLYPNLVQVNRDTQQLFSEGEKKLRIHSSSVVYQRCPKNHTAMIAALPSDWCVYDALSRIHMSTTAKGISLLSSLTVALFAAAGQHSTTTTHDALSDVDGIIISDVNSVQLAVDTWVSFRGNSVACQQVAALRDRLSCLLQRRWAVPSRRASQSDEETVRCIAMLLNLEEAKVDPAVSAMPAYRRPAAPQSHPQSPASVVSGSQTTTRYFVVKCKDRIAFNTAFSLGIWSPARAVASKLAAAVGTSSVLLVIAIPGSRHFQALGRVMRVALDDEKQSQSGATSFQVEWINTKWLSFQSVKHLRNPLAGQREITWSTDGQELEPSTGAALRALWDTCETRPSTGAQNRSTTPLPVAGDGVNAPHTHRVSANAGRGRSRGRGNHPRGGRGRGRGRGDGGNILPGK